MPIPPGARVRVKTFPSGKRVRLTFKNNKVIEHKKMPKALGEQIENIHGKIPMGQDKFSHNLNHPASEKPRNMAINAPKYKSVKPAGKRDIFEIT